MLYAVIDLFEKLNEMIESNVELWVIFPYYLNSIPLIVVQTAPIAVLVSIMFSLGKFNKNNEIVAMRASGISLLRILRPLIVAGFLISVALFIINDRVVPDAMIKVAEIKEEKIEKAKREKKRRTGEKIRDNIAFYGMGNRLIYAKRYMVYAKKLEDLIIHDQDENHNVTAKTTSVEVNRKNNRWLGKNVMFFHLDSQGRIIGDPEFYEEKYLNIKEGPEEFEKRRHQTEFMSFAELKGYIERLSFEGGATIRNLKVDMNQKVALPFVNLIVVLIASPFALAHTRRGGVLLGIGISVAIVLGYYAVMSVSLAMGKAGFLHPVVAAWFANVLFATGGLVLILRQR